MRRAATARFLVCPFKSRREAKAYEQEQVTGGVLWANPHPLFWLSLIPFTTAWMGKTEFQSLPVAIYGSVLLLAATANYSLARARIALHGKDSTLAVAIGKDVKGKNSPALYALAILLALVNSWLSCAIQVLVAAI